MSTPYGYAQPYTAGLRSVTIHRLTDLRHVFCV